MEPTTTTSATNTNTKSPLQLKLTDELVNNNFSFHYCMCKICNTARRFADSLCRLRRRDLYPVHSLIILFSILIFNLGDHIQFFCETRTRWTYKQLTDALGLEPNEVHFEACKDAAKSWVYCSAEKKENVRTICNDCVGRSFGEPPIEKIRGGGERKRQQFEESYRGLIGRIDAGESLEQLCRGELGGFVFQRITAVKALRSAIGAPRNTPEEWSYRSCIVYFGGTGLGKSRAVREECARFGHRLWVAPIGSNGKW